jgi:hypothetical protein
VKYLDTFLLSIGNLKREHAILPALYANMFLPAKYIWVVFQASNFRIIFSRRGEFSNCSGDSSTPIWHPKYLIVVSLGTHRKLGSRIHEGEFDWLIHSPTLLYQLLWAPDAKLLNSFFGFDRIFPSPLKRTYKRHLRILQWKLLD